MTRENFGLKLASTDVLVVCSDGERRWAHETRALPGVYYVELGSKLNPRREFGRLERCQRELYFVTCLERGA